MNKLHLLVLALAFCFAVPHQAIAQTNEIVITTVDSANTGEATGGGTFTLAAGYKVDKIVMTIFLDNVLVKTVDADNDCKNWKGLAISLKSGSTYEIGGLLYVSGVGIDLIPTKTKKSIKVK